MDSGNDNDRDLMTMVKGVDSSNGGRRGRWYYGGGGVWIW